MYSLVVKRLNCLVTDRTVRDEAKNEKKESSHSCPFIKGPLFKSELLVLGMIFFFIPKFDVI